MEEKFNILVVDDEEMICQAVTAYFTANGYTVLQQIVGKRLLMYLAPKNRFCHFRLNATGNDRGRSVRTFENHILCTYSYAYSQNRR